MAREAISVKEAVKKISLVRDRYYIEKAEKLHANLALPSYVHGYSLAIQYMYDWFKSKFDKDFFVGGIYIDGKNVLDDYKRLNDFAMRNIIKGHNPRARMAPSIEYDFDREGLDLYQAAPEVYLRRSGYQDAFFKDYDRDLFLGYAPRGIRMNVSYKVRLNTRAQQLDTFNRMELYFRNGATQSNLLSVDFHVPKYIMLDIAEKAGFEIKDGEVVNIIQFLYYLNLHSNLPFLYKLRAINQKSEFFIRVNDLYTHIAVRDKLSLDDGERDGKLDFNFGVEMNATLTMPIPHYYAYYSAKDITTDVIVKEQENCIAVYSINVYDIPKVDEHGWNILCITDYAADKGETEIDIGAILNGDNPVSKAINHQLAQGVSPAKFINIELYRDEDIFKIKDYIMNWEEKKITLKIPSEQETIHIAIYCDNAYVNELETELKKYKDHRITIG